MVPVTPDRRDLAHKLRAAGAQVVEVECIAIAPPTDTEALSEAASRWMAGEYEWLTVTSRNAVIALDKAARLLGGTLATERSKVATVGEATTRACEHVGLEVHLTPERPDAAGVVAAFPEGHGRVLVPVGNLAPAVLERGLTRKGWDVDLVEAYRTVDGPGMDAATVASVLNGGFDALVLTSASVAQRIRRDLGDGIVPERTAVVAIGNTTAAAAGAEGLRPTAISARPSHDGILETLVGVL
jgi:uroporphyrinogen-III synthase